MRYAIIDRDKAMAAGLPMDGRSTNISENKAVCDEVELKSHATLYEGAQWKSLAEIENILSEGGFAHE